MRVVDGCETGERSFGMVDVGDAEVGQEDGFVIWANKDGAERPLGVLGHGLIL